MGKKKKGDIKNYTFSVDASDPKYAKLIEFLDNADSGARSFIVRQILNSYVNGQTTDSLINVASSMINVDKSAQHKADANHSDVTEEKKEEVVEEPIKEKKKLPSQLANLKNQFGS